MATQQNRSMVSEVSICNQALGWLGENLITSLDDPSRNANLCRDNYPFLRDAVLEECMWTFAMDRASSTVADKDDWGLYYEHPKPLEWLQVFRVYTDVSSQDPSKWIQSVGWSIEGEYILSPDPTIYMWGTKRITDTGKFSQLFVQALAARMAADLAMPLTEDRQKQADMWGIYQAKIRLAANRDGQQARAEKIRSGSATLTKVRYR